VDGDRRARDRPVLRRPVEWIVDRAFKLRFRSKSEYGAYVKSLRGPATGLGLSFAVMQNCDLDPLKNPQGQVVLAASLGASLKQTLEMLDRLELH
jgi:hypothetical protein